MVGAGFYRIMIIRRFYCAVAVVVAVVVMAGGERAYALFKCETAAGKYKYVSSAAQCPGAYQDRSLKVAPSKSRSKSADNKSAPSSKISSRKQRKMDQKRREILDYELASELQKQRAFREQLQSGDAISQKQRVILTELYNEHERNIVAIRRELSKLPPAPLSPEVLEAQAEKRAAQLEQQQQTLLQKLKLEARKQFALRKLIEIASDDEKRTQLIKQHDQHARNIIALKQQLRQVPLDAVTLLGNRADSDADHSGN